MKKKTKQILISLFILGIMIMSSIAFVQIGIFGNSGTEETKTLDTFVVDGELNPATENSYMQKGYTFLKVSANDTLFLNAFDSYPKRFVTPTGQQQLIVEKISNATEVRIEIHNYNTNIVLNSTNETATIDALCNSLYATPLECALMNEQILKTTNSTS